MNRTILYTTLFATLCATPLTALAAPRGPACDGPPSRTDVKTDEDAPGGRHFERLAAILDLSREQRRDIDALREAEHHATAPYRRQLRENREALRDLTRTEEFDEAAVRRLARGKTDAEVELLVAHARTRNQIYALFTPQQRKLAERLDLDFDKRGPGRHGFRAGE